MEDKIVLTNIKSKGCNGKYSFPNRPWRQIQENWLDVNDLKFSVDVISATLSPENSQEIYDQKICQAANRQLNK